MPGNETTIEIKGPALVLILAAPILASGGTTYFSSNSVNSEFEQQVYELKATYAADMVAVRETLRELKRDVRELRANQK